MTCTCNLSTWKVKAGSWGVQGHPWLYSEFEASLGYMRFLIKYSKEKKNFKNKSRLFIFVAWFSDSLTHVLCMTYSDCSPMSHSNPIKSCPPPLLVFPRFRTLGFVCVSLVWLGLLCKHWVGTVHWSLGSPVDTQLKAMTPPLLDSINNK